MDGGAWWAAVYAEVPASTRDKALFHCDKPSGVPRGPAKSTASLTSQKHPGKFPHSWAVGEKKCVTKNEYNKKRNDVPKVKDVH